MFGGKIIRFFAGIGKVTLLVKSLIFNLPFFIKRRHLVLEQMLFMGVNSLPLVIFTSIFTGAVSAVQAAYQFHNYVPLRYLGTAVGKAVVIELGPVLTGLVVAGRVGAAIAAELGTMKVTEQIDALETMALDPVEFLVMPRYLAGLIMLPVLTVFADVVAILGGLAVSVWFVGVSSYTFLNGFKSFFEMQDLFAGLFKAGVFGSIIAIIGCYQGFITEGGAEGVGESTTRAVVLSSVLILVSDYMIAHLLFG
ncbi:MAG: MlaE family lipid ABC transporter permease subunit [candidate division Zixibacteria bacterium]|nr:MlaE family lipid ABC transporter permease subunit [candidate division Zixibacteria bacterium]